MIYVFSATKIVNRQHDFSNTISLRINKRFIFILDFNLEWNYGLKQEIEKNF